MPPPLRILLYIAKWFAIAFFGFYAVIFLVFGISAENQASGAYAVRWSGLEALWDEDEPFGLGVNGRIPVTLDGVDGPYVLGDRVYRVTAASEVVRATRVPGDSLWVVPKHALADSFAVPLRAEHPVPPERYPMPERLVALSDIEGNFAAFAGLLRAHGIIGDDLGWMFGDGHLVLVGDFVDRGDDVLPVLWLIYRLEAEALAAGGRVHYVLGNHEQMNLDGRAGYARPRYRRAAQEISGTLDWDTAFRTVFSERAELGRWLRSKNVAEQIGATLFVHAGVSPSLAEYGLGISDLNRIARAHLGVPRDSIRQIPDGPVRVVMGSRGPLWYRGLVREPDEAAARATLAHLGAERIAIGHTVVGDITTDLGGAVIRLDVKHGDGPGSPKTRALLIESGALMVIDGTGGRRALR